MIVAEVVLTAVFIWVILGATEDRAPKGFGPLAIGLAPIVGSAIAGLTYAFLTAAKANPAPKQAQARVED